MRILIINTLYHPYKVGGAERSVQALAENLADNHILVGVVTLGTEKESYVLNGVKVWRLKMKNLFWPFSGKDHSGIQKFFWHVNDINNKRYKNELQKIFEEFNPDVINTNNLAGFSINIWELVKANNLKVIHTLRDYYLQCPKTNKFRINVSCVNQCLECKILSWRKKKESRKVDGLIGISNYILQDHIKRGYFKNAEKRIINNGFVNYHQQKREVKFEKKNKINFGFIGQINKSKGIELLLESFSRLKDKDNWRLFIAGRVDENYRNELAKYLFSDQLTFLGYTEANDFYKKIDVLVVPSIWEEPFGRVVVEGLMNRVVVLGSKKGGIPELFEEENRSFLFAPDVENLTLLLDKILLDPSILNDFKFTEDHRNKFSIKTLVEQYKEVFNQITANADET
ncbi:glycosyltransferase family 4 protein [Sinomicrobium kalidii]|uniref:glycosyltransferase family 4 protein n=1 Tax=Sinomicrobium kalidii TaxID=2900738 RepID=UPI001E5C50AB|nr:glycosyltransferase family 4 protein [Sinomicrobium kalidii]UGU17992.1 glycosyltransferase family 4 protein [Sinomicrobium kalidii]